MPFFITQFLGAFNDNVYKNAMVILITFHLTATLDTHTLVNLAAGLFILPFFLFSATAGQIADKFEKSRLMRIIKSWEIVIMTAGALALYLKSVPLLLLVLFFMGTQSAFFGPAKYGILPQLLHEQELVGGNGLVESGTFLAILVGTLAGGVLVNLDDYGHYIVAALVIVLAILGRLASSWIPPAPAVDPGLDISWNALAETKRMVGFATESRTIFLSILGVSWFWFYGAIFLAQFPNYTKQVLGGDGTVATLLLTVFSLGIGIGSLLCERLSRRRIELGLVPIGSIGLTLFGIDLAFAHAPYTVEIKTAGEFLSHPANWRVLADLGLIALFGGIYIVPLFALIQNRAVPQRRSRIIAANNIISAFAMVIAAAMSIALLRAGLGITDLFLTVALMNAAVAVFIYTLVPEFLMRLVIWVLVHTIYRIHKEDLHHIPETGPAVLVCNHVSFVDALVIAAVSPRPVRFVMHHSIYKLPVLNFIFRTGKAIPIASPREEPKLTEDAFDRIAEALDQGELVCIFPEGRITEDGEINAFRPGIERIIERTPVPVVPLALRGLWGTFFSRKYGGRAMSAFPRRLWSRIAIVSGTPLSPAYVCAPLLKGRVAELRGDWL
ncbi:MAG: MFS transporter [Gammaproteobacteria bacterium]|nr:MFS transporter [Gammaproteobacteria bacterium]